MNLLVVQNCGMLIFDEFLGWLTKGHGKVL